LGECQLVSVMLIKISPHVIWLRCETNSPSTKSNCCSGHQSLCCHSERNNQEKLCCGCARLACSSNATHRDNDYAQHTRYYWPQYPPCALGGEVQAKGYAIKGIERPNDLQVVSASLANCLGLSEEIGPEPWEQSYCTTNEAT